MSYKPLDDIDRRIRDRLREGSCGFNELCRDLKRCISRNPLRKRLDKLVKMRLVKWKRGRRGQKHVIELTENLTRFEEKVERSETHWKNLFYKLNQLERWVEDGLLDPEEAGKMLVWLIFDALPLLAIGLIGVKSFSIDARKKLYDLSGERFNNFWENIVRLGYKHPKLSQGFRKSCKDLNEYVKPAVEAVEDWFKKLAELEQHESK